jgi:16S rRNA (cytosine1402-N4)-methyltransferase
LAESIAGLNIHPDGIYVDVTFGGGGHSREIMRHLDHGRLIAFDQDEDATQNLIEDERFSFVNSNFSRLSSFLKFYQGYPCDGILADLGVSSHQFDVPERGFSTRFDGPLDLRMDTRKGINAADYIASVEESDLALVFFKYGELPNARRVANRIVYSRNQGAIETVFQLKEALASLAPRGKENSFYARVFQALRIEINHEMDVLSEFLVQSIECLKPGGRLVVISYHSLEDRLVKNIMKSGNLEGVAEKDFYGNLLTPFSLITRKPMIPTEEEIALNSRARSAKLRIAEKK